MAKGGPRIPIASWILILGRQDLSPRKNKRHCLKQARNDKSSKSGRALVMSHYDAGSKVFSLEQDF